MSRPVPLWAAVCVFVIALVLVGAIAWWSLRPRAPGEIGQPMGGGMGPPPEVMRQVQQFGGAPRPGGAAPGASQMGQGVTR